MIPRLLVLSAAACWAIAAGCGVDEPPDPPDVEIPRPGQGTEPRFGYNEDFIAGRIDGPLLARSGSDIARRPLTWAGIERRRGRLDFGAADDAYEQLLAAGVRPLWVLLEAPCWAAAVPCPVEGAPAPGRERFDDFARFAARVAERYPQSAGIQIFNEPNLERFFVGGGGPSFYARLFERAAQAIAEVDPRMPVVTAGLSPVAESRPDARRWRPYRAAMAAAGLRGSADAIGIHLYPVTGRPEAGFAAAIREKLAAAEELADGLPIWVTELGRSTTGRLAVGAEQQARDLLGAYRLLARRGAEVIVVHRLFDLAEHELPIEIGFGVVESDRETLKPAFCALAGARGMACP